MASQTWKVVGGADTDGIVVRASKALGSAAKEGRLSTGALVREEERAGNRLRYTRLTGTGPDSGWVSITTKEKPLLIKATAADLADKPSAAAAAEDKRSPRKTAEAESSGQAGGEAVVEVEVAKAESVEVAAAGAAEAGENREVPAAQSVEVAKGAGLDAATDAAQAVGPDAATESARASEPNPVVEEAVTTEVATPSDVAGTAQADDAPKPADVAEVLEKVVAIEVETPSDVAGTAQVDDAPKPADVAEVCEPAVALDVTRNAEPAESAEANGSFQEVSVGATGAKDSEASKVDNGSETIEATEDTGAPSADPETAGHPDAHGSSRTSEAAAVSGGETSVSGQESKPVADLPDKGSCGNTQAAELGQEPEATPRNGATPSDGGVDKSQVPSPSGVQDENTCSGKEAAPASNRFGSAVEELDQEQSTSAQRDCSDVSILRPILNRPFTPLFFWGSSHANAQGNTGEEPLDDNGVEKPEVNEPQTRNGKCEPVARSKPSSVSWFGKVLNKMCTPSAPAFRHPLEDEMDSIKELKATIEDPELQKSLATTLQEAASALKTSGEIKEAGHLAVKLQDAAFTFLRKFEEVALREGRSQQQVLEENTDSKEAPRTAMKCCSPGCEYAVHSSEKYGSYCCIACFETMGYDHGSRCEKKLVEGEAKPEEPPPEQAAGGQDAAAAEKGEANEGAEKETGEKDAAAALPPTEAKEAEPQAVAVELSPEEKEAKAAMQEAKDLAKKLQDVASALLSEDEKGATGVPLGGKGQDLLGGSVADQQKSGDKLMLAKSLQEAAAVLLKDDVLEKAGKLARKLQDTAFTLLTEDTAPKDEETEAKKKVKHAESALKEEAPKTVAEWRADIAKHLKNRDDNSVAQTYQDASSALLKEGKLEEARKFAKDAESCYRKMGSRWRLGVVLDTLASANLQLAKQLEGDDDEQNGDLMKVMNASDVKELKKAALDAANEAVSLLRKIGHPKEEVDLARARATLASIRELLGDDESLAGGKKAPTASSPPKRGKAKKKEDVQGWREAVARQRALYRQAPEGRGDVSGLVQTLQAAALIFLKHGAAEDARQAAEEAAGIYRQMRAPRRLGVALDTVARAHLSCRSVQDRESPAGSGAAALWERQHHLKAKTAATEAVAILSQGTAPDWLSACVAARCTLLRVRAIDHVGANGSETRRKGIEEFDSLLPLQRTFGYAGGLEKPIAFARYDVRDEVCLKAGGFIHGQLVRDQDGNRYVAVGVKASDDEEKLPQLWFQPKSISGMAACCFPSLDSQALRSLLVSVGTEKVKVVRPEDFDAAEDSDGELVTLCHECVLPVGESRYPCQDGEGICHGECMARSLLDTSKSEDKAREREENKTKNRNRDEYNIGWKPDRMIPRNIDTIRKRRIPHPQGAKPDTMYCLMLEGSDPPKLRLVPTTDPEGFVNLSYLLTALQVRIRAGMAPYFSLDTPNADEAWQVKTFGPSWLKGTAVGEVLFQADYHLKELSMGDSLFEQPAVGMKNCWDFSWKQEGWRGREWFVVKHAKVHLSSNNVLLPQVEMGVEAREQVANAQKQLVDAPVTSTGHPLVKYAEMFSHNFDLIAERKSVVYQLREVSKAAIVAKFLVDNKVSLDDCWLKPDNETSLCKMDLPFNKKERFFYDILVRDGAIHEHHGGVLSSMVGLYGGVDLNIDAFDLSMPIHRLSKAVKAPDYSAIYAEPGQMGSAKELASLPTREIRRLIQEHGGAPPRGPVDKVDLIDLLLQVSPPAAGEDASAAAADDAAGEDGKPLPYDAAGLESDLRRLTLNEDSVRAVLSAVRTRALGEGAGKAELPTTQRGFWEGLDDDSNPKAALFKAVFRSRLADRHQEGGLFVPPLGKDSYIKKLQALVDEEREVQEKRKRHFFSKEFVTSAPGDLFPTSWKPTFSMHFARGSSVAAGGDASRGGQLVESSADPSDLLQASKPVWDRSTEDGVRFRVYRRGTLEARTVQESEDAKEVVGAVFEAQAPPPPADHHPIIKATEYVASGEEASSSSQPAQPAAAEPSEAEPVAPPPPLYRYFVVYETDLGDVIFTELRPGSNGGGGGEALLEPAWEENPPDMEERYSAARVLRVADCSGSGITVGQLREQHRGITCSGLSSRRYAQRALELAGGTPIVHPGQLRPPEQGEEAGRGGGRPPPQQPGGGRPQPKAGRPKAKAGAPEPVRSWRPQVLQGMPKFPFMGR